MSIMTDLRFVYNWTEEPDYGGEEYTATFADLEIHVGETCITQHVATDEDDKRVYDALRRPLYPIAEWLAGNWWNLFYETITQGKTEEADYVHRHNLRYGRDGFALPDVEFRPEGDTVSVRWENSDLEYYRTKFIEDGHVHIQTESLKRAISHFLDSVDDRLKARDIDDTPFQAEWDAIRSADEEEAVFCRAAARLGLYPYQVSDAQEAAILEVAEHIPDGLYPAFFGAAQPEMLVAQAQRLSDILTVLRDLDVRADQLLELKREFPRHTSGLPPWEEGYAYAQSARDLLDLNGARFDSTPELAEAFGLPSNGEYQSIQEYNSGNLFEALVAVGRNDVPGFALDKERDENKRFALCRSVFEYLITTHEDPLLITRERTERQQRNRAFAAEFLSPSALLSEAVSGRSVDDEEVSRLAEAFGVSPFVVHYQLKNHDLVNDFGYDLPEVEFAA